MKEINKEEARNIILNILDDVSKFCDEHGLEYTLAYGTLIGAVRHKGFIPWDDDVDINMPRPDYEQFITLYKKTGKYKLCAVGEKDCPLFHTKVYDDRTAKYENGVDYSRYRMMGVDIDIFPLDGMPCNNITEYNKIIKKIRTLYHLFYIIRDNYSHISLKYKPLYMFFRIIGCSIIPKIYNRIAKRYDYTKSQKVGYYCPYGTWSVYSRYVHNKSVFQDRVYIKFENKEYWAPLGYDEYLTDIYGDYMKLPPKDKQLSQHSFKLYWKE